VQLISGGSFSSAKLADQSLLLLLLLLSPAECAQRAHHQQRIITGWVRRQAG
jgi:hypothetical protein